MSTLTHLFALEAMDQKATSELFALVYDELRRIAASQLAQDAPGNTLQPTALVHEAYLRLVREPAEEDGVPRWRGRAQFFYAAAEAMRRILIESARRKMLQKHGGGSRRICLDLERIAEPELAEEVLALDEALTILAKEEPKIAELVKLRYFAGLTIKEAASALGIAPRTADVHWAYARAWLVTQVRGNETSSGE